MEVCVLADGSVDPVGSEPILDFLEASISDCYSKRARCHRIGSTGSHRSSSRLLPFPRRQQTFLSHCRAVHRDVAPSLC